MVGYCKETVYAWILFSGPELGVWIESETYHICVMSFVFLRLCLDDGFSEKKEWQTCFVTKENSKKISRKIQYRGT